MIDKNNQAAESAALQWLWDMGVTDVVEANPQPWISVCEHSNGLISNKKIETFVPSSPSVRPPDQLRFETLDALYQAIERFEGCLLRKTATRTVIADGCAASRVMIIGEAPGAEEDRTGKPFVGRAGQVLDRMLESIGRSRGAADPKEAVYISNIIFWRPPGNRTPTPAEVAACLPLVKAHIGLVQPVAILALGGPATHALTGRTDPMKALRGRWLTTEVHGVSIPVLPTYHPAYLLRTPAQKAHVWKDLLDFSHHIKSAVYAH